MTYSKETIDEVLNSIAKEIEDEEIEKKYNVSLEIINKWKEIYKEKINELKITIENSKKINLLINEGKYKEALELCKNYLNYKYIASQYIKVLTILGNYEEAIKVCNNFLDNNIILSQYINILIKQQKYNEAEKICLENMQYLNIVSEYITILLKLKRKKEAIEICENYPDRPYIQSQYINILISKRKYNAALEICERFPDYEPIQSQRISILKRLKRYDEAAIICHKFPKSFIINVQFKKMLNDVNCTLSNKEAYISSNETFSFDNSNLLIDALNQIKSSSISKDEIECLTLSYFQKKILVILDYYNKNYPINLILFEINKLKEQYKDNELCLKTIKQFLNIVKSKQKLFDVGKYFNMLNKDFENTEPKL